MGIASWLRRRWLEVAWTVFAAANVVVIFLLTRWETIPFHLIWVSLTIVYGYRVWRDITTWRVLAAVTLVTGVALLWSVIHSGNGHVDEMAEVPLMAAMFVAMVWHANRAEAAMEEVRRMADREHRLLEREREFVRDASHELRTPITVARGHAELIRRGGAPQTAADADVVVDALDRLSRLSERLLILAASEHPDFLRRVAVDLEDLVESAVRRWKPTASRAWEIRPSGSATVDADRERLDAALDALLENAVEWTEEGDRIGLAWFREEDHAVIEVEDSGSGIPSSQADRIFERFARADGARDRRRGGTGLGLAIVKAIVEAHGGTVSVRSVPGDGSTFRLSLPGARVTAGEPDALPPMSSHASARSGSAIR